MNEHDVDFKDLYVKNDFKMFEENRLPLSKFQSDLHKSMTRENDWDHVDEAVVMHYVDRPYDTNTTKIQTIIERARGMSDLIKAMGHMLTLFDYMEDEFSTIDNRLNMIQGDLRNLKIDNMGPPGERGLAGPRGEPGPPGPSVDEEVKVTVKMALSEMKEAMELIKDMQEQIDDLAEEL